MIHASHVALIGRSGRRNSFRLYRAKLGIVAILFASMSFRVALLIWDQPNVWAIIGGGLLLLLCVVAMVGTGVEALIVWPATRRMEREYEESERKHQERMREHEARMLDLQRRRDERRGSTNAGP